MWRDRDPAAAERLAAARALIGELATAHHLPPENLLQPDLLRRVCWTPPSPVDTAALSEALRAGGARPWQVGLLAEPLAAALVTLG
jgi:ribonuclease D